jgi:transposase
MKPYKIFVGIDVAKKSLEVSSKELTLPRQIGNEQKEIKGLVKTLKRYRQKVLVVCESTGGLEMKLVQQLQEEEIDVSVINPTKARHFALSAKQVAKTDKIDAAMLAEYGQRMQPEPTPQAEPQVRSLAALVARREDLVQMRTAERNRRQQSTEATVIKSLEESLKTIEANIKRLEQQMSVLVVANPALAQKFKQLCSVEGVGKTVAHVLLATMPELGTLERNEVAHLIGVAPLNNDSGL